MARCHVSKEHQPPDNLHERRCAVRLKPGECRAFLARLGPTRKLPKLAREGTPPAQAGRQAGYRRSCRLP
jgi:hypothetical protein